MLVNFMIIGAQKCGTSTLFEMLNDHPSLVGCTPKEPNFFSKSKNWRNEIIQYHTRYKKVNGAQYFEASTSYTFYPLRNLRIWDDIYEYNPDMRFIYIARNPLDRIISSYMHSYERGYTDRSIEDALIEERIYIELTRYYTQISPYIKKFGRNNILLLNFEDLIKQPETVLENISDFLLIDYDGFNKLGNVHSNVSIGGYKIHHKFDPPSIPLRAIRTFIPPLWEKIIDNSKRGFSQKPILSYELREMILNMLELEIIEFEKLLGQDLSGWLSLDCR